ncbi:MAG: exodeoxyribonuclease III, partial [Rhodospirillaceae bacterium]|nr:exodeoxyribonuclease III [Rhodospirillaceae bacterium]
MKLVTWNINSIRPRLNLVERLVAVEDHDVICLQESKVEDGKFPRES